MIFCVRTRACDSDGKAQQQVLSLPSAPPQPGGVSHPQLFASSCSPLAAIGCTKPEIENGKVTGLETTYRLEDTAVFECNVGYALKGSQESQCQFGGKWHPPLPTCEKRKCQ